MNIDEERRYADNRFLFTQASKPRKGIRIMRTPTQLEVLHFLICKSPGRTGGDLAEAIHGRREQPLINGDIRLLESRGLIERRGAGGRNDPYRLWPKKSARIQPISSSAVAPAGGIERLA
jgi:hypothetical protein